MEENKLDKRSIARIQAMKIIYIADFNGISIDSSLTMGKSGFFNDNIAGEYPISEETIELLKYVTDNLEKIDGIIKETITNYSIDRLNLVDKAIIRVATGEMLLNKLDRRIIINEALEITKLYSDQGDHKATSFNNRLLDNISKKI